jgi:hypothetical protein
MGQVLREKKRCEKKRAYNTGPGTYSLKKKPPKAQEFP